MPIKNDGRRNRREFERSSPQTVKLCDRVLKDIDMRNMFLVGIRKIALRNEYSSPMRFKMGSRKVQGRHPGAVAEFLIALLGVNWSYSDFSTALISS